MLFKRVRKLGITLRVNLHFTHPQHHSLLSHLFLNLYIIICLAIPDNFYAVGAFYQSFSQVSDEEVIHLLKKAKEDRKSNAQRH